MTTETLIQKVRDEVGTLDANGEQLLIKAMKILQGVSETTEPQPAKERFVSQNITPEEYEALPRAERRHYQDEAEELNRHWVENQLNRYNAKWIMVIDGQVVRHGATLDDYPEDEDFLALCEKTGKYPFVFLSASVFAIEESSTSWHLIKDKVDAYPALVMAISGNNHRLETEADLDTGASDCYCDLELLTANQVVKLYSNNFEKNFATSEPTIHLFHEAIVSRNKRQDWGKPSMANHRNLCGRLAK